MQPDEVLQFGHVGELRVVLERRLPGLFERGLGKAVLRRLTSKSSDGDVGFANRLARTSHR